jgi:hypothetical protein
VCIAVVTGVLTNVIKRTILKCKINSAFAVYFIMLSIFRLFNVSCRGLMNCELEKDLEESGHGLI